MKIFLIKTLIFNNLLVKALINDYFNDKLLLMLPKLQSNAQKRQNNLISGKKKNTRSNIATSVVQKLLQQVFRSKKHDYALFKESKLHL
ncbi:hypothetical protein MNU24_06230 [Spiroplasma poulsonii]|nr:hypothetical protein [Spiroplasma poulsonii]UNF61509.1 hypothetical protein MNU24_06230 [Spiroplasma poulsonii]